MTDGFLWRRYKDKLSETWPQENLKAFLWLSFFVSSHLITCGWVRARVLLDHLAYKTLFQRREEQRQKMIRLYILN